MKIRAKLTAILVLVAIAGIAISVVISFVVAHKGIEKRINEHLQSVAILKKYHLNCFVKERINDIAYMANDNLYNREAFLGGTKVKIRNILKEKLVNNKEFIELFIVDLDGEVYLSTDKKQEGKIKSYEKYFIEGKKGPFIQSFYYDLSLQQPSMTISAPIKDDQGSLSDLLVGRVDLKGISYLMTERSGLGETGETYLVNRFNYLVTESRFEEGLAFKKSIYTEGVKDCLKGNNDHRIYNNYRGTPVLGFYEWIPEIQVCLLVEISQKEAFASINRLRNILILVSIGIVILVVILGFFFSKIISKPLEKLIRGTEIIGKGDLEHRVDVRTKDEIGKLALAFNDMTKRRQEAEDVLRKYRNSLEELVEERTVELKKVNEKLQHEIVEHKRVEEALQNSEKQAAMAIEAARGFTFSYDIATGKINWGGAIEEITGYTPEEFSLVDIDGWAERIHPDDKDRIVSILQEAFQRDRTATEYRFKTKNGDYVVLSSISLTEKDETARAIRLVGIVQDITERKRLEAQLRHAQRMESIGTLAGGIAHNFNNLLMGMQGNVSLMLFETDSDHPNYERLKNIEKMVQGGSKLTSQLLGYARGGRYAVRPISFNQLVRETSDTFDITRKNITVHQDLNKALFEIIADQGQIEQVLLNLYVNAADAMPKGGDLFLKTINVTHEDMKDKPYVPKPGNYALLTVRDTGVGMDNKTKERIFDPFFTTKGLAKGTGLGLASVYGIIEAHGGYIDVESKRGHDRPPRLSPTEWDAGGQGTTFYIYLPASEEKEVIEKEKFPEEVSRGKETVLLVDDEEMILDVGRQMLNRLGYNVLIAEGGKEALDIYEKNQEKIDIVLLDMIMPGVGGGKAYDRMKEINPNIKVLLSSGYSINGQATEILKRGCNGFLQKPFTMDELFHSIREILEEK